MKFSFVVICQNGILLTWTYWWILLFFNLENYLLLNPNNQCLLQPLVLWLFKKWGLTIFVCTASLRIICLDFCCWWVLEIHKFTRQWPPTDLRINKTFIDCSFCRIDPFSVFKKDFSLYVRTFGNYVKIIWIILEFIDFKIQYKLYKIRDKILKKSIGMD